MARTKTIKPDSVIGDKTFLYQYEGWEIQIKKQDGLTYLLSRKSDDAIPMQAVYTDGKILFHFPTGNAYGTKQIDTLTQMMGELKKIEEALNKKWFSAQK